MTRYVLDASVAAKWFLSASDESYAEEALALLRLYAAGSVQFFVPDLFFAEFGNILWKAERLGRCDSKTADLATKAIIDRKLPSFSSGPLLSRALQIARRHGRTVYDSLYLALAVDLDGTLVTADERLANSVRGRLPVRWLGSL